MEIQKTKNMSIVDSAYVNISHVSYILNRLYQISEVATNWYDLILFGLGIKKEIYLVTKDRTKVKISTWDDYNKFLANHFMFGDKKFVISRNVIQLKYKNKKLKFYFDNFAHKYSTFYALNENFMNGQYKWLKVRNNTVIDVGGFVGDTAIYFILNGAEKVFALEPDPNLYKTAKKNIKVNHLKNKIKLLSTACVGNKKSNSGKGLSIKEIVEKFGLNNAILKMDCEGCEYDSILNTDPDLLHKAFKQIIIEYHYGYINLKNHLIKSGFKVECTRPKKVTNFDSHENLYVGLLYAKKAST